MSKEWVEDKKKQLESATVFINENGNEAVEISLTVLTKLFEQVERVPELEKEIEHYREAINLLNNVAWRDIKASIGTNSHFVVDVTSEALEGDSNE